MKKKNISPIQAAIDFAGTEAALAKLCGVSQPTISKWLKKGIVPPRRVLLINELTGIPCYELNPHVYKREE